MAKFVKYYPIQNVVPLNQLIQLKKFKDEIVLMEKIERFDESINRQYPDIAKKHKLPLTPKQKRVEAAEKQMALAIVNTITGETNEKRQSSKLR